MARKVGQHKNQKPENIKYNKEVTLTDKLISFIKNTNGSYIFFRMDQMREMLDRVKGVISTEEDRKSLGRLREKSGTGTGIVCTWYNIDDVKRLLGLIGDEA